ncbi:hypothetical protein H6G52_05455 [Limnothrix sp. FACHB-881]|uniref:hypothetical protein n=1 Tax=Limnothrix sp. FACHB-881 TaxID=2692819 RepID=UPI001687ABBE|nr:hypothetical protein [Limnothrix sp. FACHB-881]MBD2634800.1 hypothetical protein [Limnothrix sp. FACHB-881]
MAIVDRNLALTQTLPWQFRPKIFWQAAFRKPLSENFFLKISQSLFKTLFFNYSLYLELLARHIADAMKQRFGGQCSPYGRLCLVIEVRAVIN